MVVMRGICADERHFGICRSVLRYGEGFSTDPSAYFVWCRRTNEEARRRRRRAPIDRERRRFFYSASSEWLATAIEKRWDVECVRAHKRRWCVITF